MFAVARLLALVLILGGVVGMARSSTPRYLPAPEMPDKIEISGYIDRIAGTQSARPSMIVVGDIKVYVTSTTQIIKLSGTTRTTTLKVGMKVSVIGFFGRDGAIMASTIYIQ